MPLYLPGSTVPSGSSFPVAPLTGDKFWRTDRNIEYYYDGTRWLSFELFTVAFPIGVTQAATYESDICHPHAGTYDIYVTKFHLAVYQSLGTTSANYFNCLIRSVLGSTVTPISSTISSQNDATSTWIRKTSVSPNVVVPNTEAIIQFSATEVGTQSGFFAGSFNYRLVG